MASSSATLTPEQAKRLLAAYEIGRDLNNAAWQLAHLSFCGDSSAGIEFRKVLACIGLKARDFVPACEADEFERSFEQLGLNVYDYYTGSHCTELRAAINEELAARDLEGTLDSYHLEDARSEFRSEVIDKARRLLLSRLEPQAVQLLTFGERVDQLIRPRSVEEHLYRYSTTLIEPGKEWIDATGAGRHRTDGTINLFHHDNRLLGNTSLLPGQAPSDPNWAMQVQHLWDEIEYLRDCPTVDLERIDAGDHGDPFSDACVSARLKAVELLDSHVRAAFNTVPTESEPGYLGLVLLPNQQVKRHGRDDLVEIRNQNSWELLQLLVANRDGRTTLSAFQSLGHDRAAYYNAKSDLTDRLEILGVTIDTVRNVGYRLIETSANGAQRKSNAGKQKRSPDSSRKRLETPEKPMSDGD